MYEVDCTGFERTPENLAWANLSRWFRFRVHAKRVWFAVRWFRGWRHLRMTVWDCIRLSGL